jgi:hypothetical protein
MITDNLQILGINNLRNLFQLTVCRSPRSWEIVGSSETQVAVKRAAKNLKGMLGIEVESG